MKVLIVDFDLFAKEGGGQTVYRNIILRNRSIDFTHLATKPAETTAPDNSKCVPLASRFMPEYVAMNPADELYYSAYLTARNVAYSVRGMDFDVVDIPDYYSFGGFLSSAFREFDVKVGKIVLSLHGRLSETMFQNWNSYQLLAGNGDAGEYQSLLSRRQAFQALEDGGLRSADMRYGISQGYIRQLQPIADSLPFEYLHPFKIIEIPEAVPHANGQMISPNLLYIGRLERAKGPDLFLDLVWLAGACDLAKVKMIGADEQYQGRSIHQMLSEQAHRRGLHVDFEHQMNRAEVLDLLAGPGMLLCTSRFESFGLVPLEAILRGSLTGFSQHCGIYSFVRETWPELKFLTLNVDRIGEATSSLREMLGAFSSLRRENMTYCRERLGQVLDSIGPSEHFMEQIYSADSRFSASARDDLDYLYLCQNVSRRFVSTPSQPSMLKAMARAIVPASVRTVFLQARSHAGRLRRGIRNTPRLLLQVARNTLARRYVPTMEIFLRELRTFKQTNLHGLPVDDHAVLSHLGNVLRVGRARIFRAMALSERRRGNVALANLYNVRCWRWTGQVPEGQIEPAADCFREHGFDAIADILPWLDPTKLEQNAEAVEKYLSSRLRKLNTLPAPEYQVHEVRHMRQEHKVSIIVSLYQAHDKLPNFTRLLGELDLVHTRTAEVIFVDSGSPYLQMDSRRIEQLAQRMDLTYIRTPKRETIPAAWNRGIAEAQGEYLVFLGADEMVTGHALGKLASYLDCHPEVDWVVGDGVVMNVDSQGSFMSEVLPYTRTGMGPFSSILDGVYLTYVGGMYRRSLHERAGYYDGTFRGASDTEFKYRIFPLARFAHIPHTLGIFMNYPEQRVTEHPRAELEDLLAIHLYKTPGGLRYLLRGKDEAAVVELFKQALSLKRCYSNTIDTDLDLAVNVIEYLSAMNPDSQRYAAWASEVGGVREFLRKLDSCDGDIRTLLRLRRQAAAIHRMQQRHRRELGVPVSYHLLNDLRYCIHANVWGIKEHTF